MLITARCTNEGRDKNKTRQVSTKLIASLAPARAEIEAGVVAKADQKSVSIPDNIFKIFIYYGIKRTSMWTFQKNSICKLFSYYYSNW